MLHVRWFLTFKKTYINQKLLIIVVTRGRKNYRYAAILAVKNTKEAYQCFLVVFPFSALRVSSCPTEIIKHDTPLEKDGKGIN